MWIYLSFSSFFYYRTFTTKRSFHFYLLTIMIFKVLFLLLVTTVTVTTAETPTQTPTKVLKSAKNKSIYKKGAKSKSSYKASHKSKSSSSKDVILEMPSTPPSLTPSISQYPSYQPSKSREWIQIGQDLYAEFFYLCNMRHSVSLSHDGTKIATSCLDNITRIYKFENSFWQQVGQDINRGGAVSLSGNGMTVVIAEYFKKRVSVFAFQDNGWKQLGQDINREIYSFGYSVSISDDGSTVSVGAPYNPEYYYRDGCDGFVQMYRFNDDAWQPMGNAIIGFVCSMAGESVSLSYDGTTVAFGLPSDCGWSDPGYVRVYTYQNGSWVKVGQTIYGDGDYLSFGKSVSLSNDGTFVASAAYGYARVYNLKDNYWEQIGQDLPLGGGVSISGDGLIVAVKYKNFAEIYKYRNGEWQLLGQSIEQSITMTFENTPSVSLSNGGNTFVFTNANAYAKGSVKVYQLQQVQ